MTEQRFEDRRITFANGSTSRHLDVPTANPVDHHKVIGAPASMMRMHIAARLFVPSHAAGPFPR